MDVQRAILERRSVRSYYSADESKEKDRKPLDQIICKEKFES